MKPFHILFTLLFLSTRVIAQEPVESVVIAYNLDGGNLNATDYNQTYFTPEPIHPHNVTMEPIVFNGLDGVISNGWEEGGDQDTTEYMHLRVNINPGYILHVDSVTLTGTGTSWYGPIVGGVSLYDADTLSGYTVGWQIFDSVLYCVSSMWYMMPHPYDTLVNWWQINSHHHLDIHLVAWGNTPDTLGNYMPSTGWVVDNIQLHGKVLVDVSTSLQRPESSFDISSVGGKPVEIYDAQGQKVSDRMSYLQDAVPGVYILRQNGFVRRVMTSR